jgi:hypothetical protein
MIPNVDESVLAKEYDGSFVKPEAPWIKRCDHGITFTDNIQLQEFSHLQSQHLSEPKEKEPK